MLQVGKNFLNQNPVYGTAKICGGDACGICDPLLIGGLLVSLFAIVGEVRRSKSFAGLFGAAPSVALATLTLAFSEHGAAISRRKGAQ